MREQASIFCTLLLCVLAHVQALSQPIPATTWNLDPGFDPGNNQLGQFETVTAMVLLPNGQMLIAGNFNSYAGVTCGNITRLNSDGTPDNTWNVGGTGFSSSTGSSYVNGLILQPDGNVLCKGVFDQYNGNACSSGLARIDATTGDLDMGFMPPLWQYMPLGNMATASMALDVNGKIVIAYNYLQSWNNASTAYIFRLESTGVLDVTYTGYTGITGAVQGISIYAGDKLVFGFDNYPTPNNDRYQVRMLDGSGNLDPGFVCATDYGVRVRVIVPQPDGKLLCGGVYEFPSAVNSIFRLNATGTLDLTFAPGQFLSNSATQYISDMELEPDGRVAVTGEFYSIGGTIRWRLAMLAANGAIDLMLDPGSGFTLPAGASGGGVGLVRQPDGKYLAYGGFDAYSGTSRMRVARLGKTCTDVTFELLTDGLPSETTWSIVNAVTNQVEMSGGPYTIPNLGDINQNHHCIEAPGCLSNGDHILTVNDAGGAFTGNYLLRQGDHGSQNKGRIVHNSLGFVGTSAQHGSGTAYPAYTSNGVFSVPIGTNFIFDNRADFNHLTNTQTLEAAPDPVVQNTPAGTANTGYVFWIYRPGASESRVIFQSLVNGSGCATGANIHERARRLKLDCSSQFATPLSLNTEYNVRVATKVNGVTGPWGPAARFSLIGTNAGLAQMNWPVHLVDLPGDSRHSCGISAEYVDDADGNPSTTTNSGGATQLFANSRGGATYAYRYRWTCTNCPPTVQPFVVNRQSGSLGNNRSMYLTKSLIPAGMANWPTSQPAPQTGQIWCVQVATRLNSPNASWFTGYGPCCEVVISDSRAFIPLSGNGTGSMMDEREAELELWPNPSSDRMISLSYFDGTGSSADLDIEVIDAMGRLVHVQKMILADDLGVGALDLRSIRSAGVYLVRCTKGTAQVTKLIVLE